METENSTSVETFDVPRGTPAYFSIMVREYGEVNQITSVLFIAESGERWGIPVYGPLACILNAYYYMLAKEGYVVPYGEFCKLDDDESLAIWDILFEEGRYNNTKYEEQEG